MGTENREHTVKILSIHNVTHNVKAFRINKPEGFQFEPGQATDVSINKEGWTDKKNPFTFTSLNEWPYLEFTIKLYRDRGGVTNELDKLRAGDELIIRDAWGAISYKGEGYFIAGGAGITPFVAILRQLKKEGRVGTNQLYFSNKTSQDIILKDELGDILGEQVHYIITTSDGSGSKQEHIDRAFIRREIKDVTKPFYVCGPDKMVSELTQILTDLGAHPDSLVFER